MSQFFAETAHHKIDREKYSQNYEHIFGKKEKVEEVDNITVSKQAVVADHEKIKQLEAQLKEANEIVIFYTGGLPDHDAEVLGYPDGESDTSNSKMWKRAKEYLTKFEVKEMK